MSPGKGGGGFTLLLLPLVFWGLLSPLPRVRPLLYVGNRVYKSGDTLLLLEGVDYPLKVELRGGLLALGESPEAYKGPGTCRDFCEERGFGIRGPWGEGGCFVLKREVRWQGKFQPYPSDDGRYRLVVPWFGLFPLKVKVAKEWLCDVRTPAGTRIQRVKEEGEALFTLRVLEARESWYRSLYVTAWGTEDQELRRRLDHLVFLLNLLEDQILKGQEGMVRLNLLAWRDALEEVRERLKVMADEGEPVGVWVRLLPSWRAWPQIEKAEKRAEEETACWKTWLSAFGVDGGKPMAVFPFPLFSGTSRVSRERGRRVLLPLFPVARECWSHWRREADFLASARASAVEADGAVKAGLSGGGTWEVGWVPWQ